VSYTFRRWTLAGQGAAVVLDAGAPELDVHYAIGMYQDTGVVIAGLGLALGSVRATLGDRVFLELRLGRASLDVNVLSVPGDSISRAGLLFSAAPSLRAGAAF